LRLQNTSGNRRVSLSRLATALVPVLLRASYSDDPLVKDIPVVFSIHNMGITDSSPGRADRIGLPQVLFHPAGIEFYGSVNLLKADWFFRII